MSSTLTTQLAAAEASVKQHSSVLHKELGFADLVFAQIVIVMIPDAFGTAAKAGQPHVLYWILGIALFFFPLTFVVAHLNRLMPLEGGLYEWARLAFNDRIGFLTAWNVWLFNAFYTGCIGLLTVAFVSYAVGPQMSGIADNKAVIVATSIALIGVLLLIAHLGLRVGKWVINFGSSMTLFALVALVCMPFVHVLHGASLDHHPLRLVMPSFSLSNLSVFSKMNFLALNSFEFVAIFAGECRNPGRNIARATFVAAPIIAFLYIFGTASILAHVSPEAVDLIAPIPQALSTGFQGIPLLGFVAPLSIGLLLANYISTYSLQFSANSRLPLVAGWDHLLPPWFTRLHPKFRTPVNSILFLGGVTLAASVAGLVGVGMQETFQLIVNWAFTFYGLAYLSLFAIPLIARKDRGIRPALWLRAAALSGLLFTMLFVVLSVFPIIDVVSRAAYSIKMVSVVLGANLVGLLLYRLGTRAARRDP